MGAFLAFYVIHLLMVCRMGLVLQRHDANSSKGTIELASSVQGQQSYKASALATGEAASGRLVNKVQHLAFFTLYGIHLLMVCRMGLVLQRHDANSSKGTIELASSVQGQQSYKASALATGEAASGRLVNKVQHLAFFTLYGIHLLMVCRMGLALQRHDAVSSKRTIELAFSVQGQQSSKASALFGPHHCRVRQPAQRQNNQKGEGTVRKG